MPIRWMVNESAPRSDTIASVTARVHAGDQRDHGDDRRHGDDVAEQRQHRAELVGPDRRQRQHDGFEELRHCGFVIRYSLFVIRCIAAPGFGATFTMSPSYMPRTESNGPVMTRSPSFSPVEHLEVALAGNADLDDDERGLAVPHQEHAFASLRASGRASARPVAAGAGAACGGPKLEARLRGGRGSCTTLPLLVVEQLAHGHRLNRHGDGLLARRRRDLGRAREARAAPRESGRRSSP